LAGAPFSSVAARGLRSPRFRQLSVVSHSTRRPYSYHPLHSPRTNSNCIRATASKGHSTLRCSTRNPASTALSPKNITIRSRPL
jgi:hypothetical protein